MTDPQTSYLNEHNKYAHLNAEIERLTAELAGAREVIAAYDVLVDGLRAEIAHAALAHA